MGLQAIAVDEPEALGAAWDWDAALSADRPTLSLDVRCDPEVPPTPPHATYEQLKDLATSVLKGDPNAWHLVVQAAKTKAQEFVPHRETWLAFELRLAG